MKIQPACVECIVNQSFRVVDAIDANTPLATKITSHVKELSKDFSFSLTPPEIAAYVYADMAKIANMEDLYAYQKQLASSHAKTFLPKLQTKLQNSTNKLLSATKIAIAGNVIDLAAEVSFDLEEELEKIFHTPFGIDDFQTLEKELNKARNVVVLGDNTGEHIFDYIFIQTLQELYPDISFSYFVRGVPIINDVTLKEAKEIGFDKLCNLIDSGVDTPGFSYNRASQEAQELFDNADLVISKGMGNYECLSPSHKQNICFLLKVKCNVVASSLGAELGDIICKVV